MKVMLMFLASAGLVCAERTVPATFYVDSGSGSDSAAGTAESAPWQSLEKINAAELIPGDRVLFRRGGVWRGQLIPQSGSSGRPIVYGAYGSGEKPVLQGSVERSTPGVWTEFTPGIWATHKFEPKLMNIFTNLSDSQWSVHTEAGAKVALTRVREENRSFVRIACAASGKAGNHIQLWGPELAGAPASLMFQARVRSSQPFRLGSVSAMLNRAPYSRALSSVDQKTEIGQAWQTVNVLLLEQQRLSGAHLHINLGDVLPAGATFDFDPLALWEASVDPAASISCDVGIVILNQGEQWGIKKWSLADLKKPLDYWYDAEDKRIFLACDLNPALKFRSIELALTRHIVNQGSRHDITYDDLAVRYGGAHGFGGGSTQRIIIRNCDVYWIGGGLQHWKKTRDGKSEYPVRFGNGIEFWGNASDNLVERNRLWQIYDAALTNQGRDDDEVNIIYRDNVIWQAEYSFEYWNGRRTANILFEHNTCVDAGDCWSHDQRPDPNGAHLMFYSNPAATTNFVIRNNIFATSTEVCVRMESDWRSGLTMQNNLYYQAEKPLFRWLGRNFFAANEFARYQQELGMDSGSLFAAPQFVDPAARDYRLKPGTPGTKLSTEGGVVGARTAAAPVSGS